MVRIHDIRTIMYINSINIKTIQYFFLALFAFSINYYFSNKGLYPIDTFSFFDTSYLITQGYHPIKDFWVISGVFVDYLQALFFLIFGSNWNAYIIHSSFLNAFISMFFFFFLNNFNKNSLINFILGISLATLCYPVAGTPFPYQHSYIFSLISIMVFFLAVKKDDQRYWKILPFFMFISFLSMQMPAGIINFLLLAFITIYFFKFKKDFLLSFVLGSVFCLLILFFYFFFLKVNLKDAFIQLFLFPLSIGEGRITGATDAYPSANLFSKLTLRGVIGHFKFIHFFILANFVGLILYLKKNLNNFYSKKIILNIFLLLCSISFIFHQLITANQTYIFSLIPFLCGFFIIQLNDFFNINSKKINIILLVLIIFTTIKYHNIYNVKRKFMDLQEVNLKNSLQANYLNKRFNNLKWITPFYFKKNPQEELDLLKESISLISKENSKEIILITHYQFFSILIQKRINIANRWYFPDNNTFPSSKNNKYFFHYVKKFNKKIEEEGIKKIYLVQSYPEEFKFINFKILLGNDCFREKKINKILSLIILNSCN